MNTEYLGVFGFAWQEKIASLVGFPITALNASIYGGIVDKVIKLNNTGKYKTPDDIARVSNVDADKIRKILLQYANYKETGKVLLVKPIPTGIQDIASSVGKGTGSIVSPIAAPLLWPIAIIASIAGIVYLSMKKGKA